MKKAYPSLSQSWGIFGVAIVAMIAFSLVSPSLEGLFGKEVSMLITYSLGMFATLLFAHQLRKKESGESHFHFKKISLLQAILAIVVTVGLQIGISVPLGNMIPMPDLFKQLFLELAKLNGWAAFATIALAAPLLEELIFRGVILDGLLRKYSPAKAIFWSSFLFALVHLNPWQFISAMVIGIFSAWLYYKTANLNLSILIHFFNNGTAFVLMQYIDSAYLMDSSYTELFGSPMQASLVIIGGICIAALGIFSLNRSFIQTVNWIHDGELTKQS